jgi:hypothetical protein
VTYYWLKSESNSPVKLELVDAKGAVRACGASDTPVKPVDTEAINVQAIWQQPTLPPSATVGMHRFALGPPPARGFGGGGGRGPAPPAPRDACSPPEGTAAAAPVRPARGGRGGPTGLQPGDYTIRLTVDGQTYTQPVTIKPDPRGVPVDHANEEVNTRS